MHKHGAGNAAQYARDLFRPAANDLYGVNAVIFRKAACHDMSGFVLYVDDITAGKFAGDSEYARWKQAVARSEEHTSELQSLMRISYAVFCLKKKTHNTTLQPKSKTQ